MARGPDVPPDREPYVAVPLWSLPRATKVTVPVPCDPETQPTVRQCQPAPLKSLVGVSVVFFAGWVAVIFLRWPAAMRGVLEAGGWPSGAGLHGTQ
jgi:hypothetical protein